MLKLVAIALLFQESLAQVTLVPVGDVHVCKGSNQVFTCSSSSSVVWTISGFSSGILDTDNPVNAFSYASTNDRLETDDTSIASNPSTLTIQNLGYADDNAVVVCLNATLAGARMSTIQIGPPNCTVDFSVMASGVTISVNLTVYACVGYLPGYEVVLSTIGNERSTISIETPAFMASSIIRISDLKAFSEYNVSLELVDPYCQNATVATKLVVTDMPPPDATVSTASSTSSTVAPCTPTPPMASEGYGGITAGVAVGCLVLSLLASVATGVITFLCTRRCYRKSSPPSPNEKSVYYETVQSDSVKMQPSPAYESVQKET